MEEVLKSLDPETLNRLFKVRSFSKSVRASEYHLTNACNIRCKGCWFFEKEFDKPGKHSGRENTDLDNLNSFLDQEVARGINTALLIGGEPTLFPDRVAAFVRKMKNVTISTNGLKPLPYEGFQDVNVAISIFGGEKSDDTIRAIRPNGSTFSGLFEKALDNYENDDRVIFIYAVDPSMTDEVIPTVKRIVENGNLVNFNYYHDYSKNLFYSNRIQKLGIAMKKAIKRWPEQVASHDDFIDAILTGQTHFGKFGYDTCPSLSVDHPENRDRLQNGNRSLPLFNAWAADLKTVLKCCTSGDCNSCRDSQAVFSWLISSPEHYMTSPEQVRRWVEIAEAYWSQFTWSDYSLYRRTGRAA